ncbi:UNVERIFIED_ORG: hypothetical protein B2H93_04735 [Clostridium botulinum]
MGNTLMYTQKIDKKMNEIIKNYLIDKKFIRRLNDELTKKGLNLRLVTAFQDRSLKPENLSETKEEDLAVRIAFMTAYYDVFKDEEFNPKKIFTNSQIIDYDSFRKIKIVLNELEFNEIKKIDNYNYEGRITYKQIYESLKYVLVRYNMKAQRDNKLLKAGTKGELSREIDLNEENVMKMKDLILSNKLEETQIILNLRIADVEEGEYFEPDYEFVPLNKIIEKKFEIQKELKNEINDLDSIIGNTLRTLGTLTIRPNYNINSEHFTVVEVNDGWHRIISTSLAVGEHYEKTGEWIEGGFAVKIVLRTLKESQELIRQIFERSDTPKSFLKSLENNHYTEFINMLGEESNILKDNISQTYNEYKINKTLSHRSILSDAIKEFTDIEVEKAGLARGIAKNLAKSIDSIIEVIAYKYFDSSIEKMRSESDLLDCNMFIGYIAIAYEMFKTKNYNYDEIADNLYCINKEDAKRLKLKEKETNVKIIYSFFNNLAKGVLSVA